MAQESQNLAGAINAPRGNLLDADRAVPFEPLAPDHYEAASTCPVESGIEVIAGRWKLLILRSFFLGGAQRFNAVLRAVEGISAKELTRNLRELETTGLIERRAAFADREGAEAYALSNLGQSLLPVFREIGSFGDRLKHDRTSHRGSGPAAA